MYPFFYSEKYHHYSHYAHISSLSNGGLATSDLIRVLTTSNLLASTYWIGLIAALIFISMFLAKERYSRSCGSSKLHATSCLPRPTILTLSTITAYLLFLSLLASARGYTDSVAYWQSRRIYVVQIFIAALVLASHSLILPNYVTAYRSMPEYLSFMGYARALPANLKIMASNGLPPWFPIESLLTSL